MEQDISAKQMYNIINRAVANCYNCKDEPVNEEIKKFQQIHWQKIQKDPQLNIFQEELPSLKEVREASCFCDLLDDFRKSIDPYNDNQEELPEKSYRKIYEYINYYRPHIEQQNNVNLDLLEKSAKRHLSEHRENMLLEEYNKEAQDIVNLRKYCKKNKKQTSPSYKPYEEQALNFFRKILNKKEIQKTKPTVKKLETYSNIINVVDCLPEEKYGRIAKYKLKISIYASISDICAYLGPSYYLARKNAKQEIEKFQNAIDNALRYGKKGKITPEELRRKRQMEEYLYK